MWVSDRTPILVPPHDENDRVRPRAGGCRSRPARHRAGRRPREVVDGGEVAGARLPATEGVGELGGGTGPVECLLLRRDVEDVELPGFVERERRDEAGEVVGEPGRARQHRLERELAGRIGVVAGEHVAEVVGDELGTTTALFAGEREAVAVEEVVVRASERSLGARPERPQPRAECRVGGFGHAGLVRQRFAEPRPVGHDPLATFGQRVAGHEEERFVDAERPGVLLDAVGLGRVARVAAELDDDEQVDDASTLGIVGADLREPARLERVQCVDVTVDAEVAVQQVLDDPARCSGVGPSPTSAAPSSPAATIAIPSAPAARDLMSKTSPSWAGAMSNIDRGYCFGS